MRCPKCGVEYPENADRCINCGNPINENSENDIHENNVNNEPEIKNHTCPQTTGTYWNNILSPISRGLWPLPGN